MVCLPKLVPDVHWRLHLTEWSKADGANNVGRYVLDQQVDLDGFGGTLTVRARVNRRYREDYSAILALTTDGGSEYRLLRCNGRGHVHANALDPGPVMANTPHVHRLTERYQRDKNCSGDGFAELTNAYSDVHGAIEHLSIIANFQPSGRLFL